MTRSDPSPPRALPLELPPAILHGKSMPLHPDSEDFIRREIARNAQELSPIERDASATQTAGLHLTPDAPRARDSLSLRNRVSSVPHSCHHGQESIDPSQISTITDSEGPDGYHIRSYRLRRQLPHWYDPIIQFWTSHVSLTIEEGSHRDHLALERTFLGYLRTSLAFAMAGVVIAQLFRLQHSTHPNHALGFYVLGVPLAAIFICFGIIVLLLGAFRFWRQQNALARGKIHTGGWEVKIIMGGSVLLCVATFITVTAIDIDKTYFQ